MRYLGTTDAKDIGGLYTVTAFGFFMVGGAMAMLMRAELTRPGQQFLSSEQYNQLFTMHGLIMLLLYATPIVFGFANCIMPLQIGSPDVAFPRLNAISYWLFLFGGLIAASGFLTPGGAPGFGWFAYTPLSSVTFSPGVGADLGIMRLTLSGLGTILGAVNLLTTIICLRAPGMTMFRMPIFTWAIFISMLLILVVFPVLAVAFLALEADRHLGAHAFDPANGGAVLWQHLFWYFGHPEVHILALPFFGIISEVIPVFSRKPLFGYVLFGTIVFATYAGIYFWFPKMTGRMMDEKLGKIHFWLTFVGFHTTFAVQHWLGNEGMPRRYADYLPTDGFTTLNTISSIGAFVLGASTLPFVYNVVRSYRYGQVVTIDDPWGHGNPLEWATSCPPPRHNFTSLPRIRSERPAFELHYPHMVARMRAEAHTGSRHPVPAGTASVEPAVTAPAGDGESADG